jgi:hypothetical protein
VEVILAGVHQVVVHQGVLVVVQEALVTVEVAVVGVVALE